MASASEPAIPACRSALNDISLLEFEELVDDIRGKSFFPLDKLRSYLTDAKCKEILSCRCPKCVSDLKLFMNLEIDDFVPLIAGRDNGRQTTPAHGLFALLIYVEHPLLIIGFLNGSCTDDDLEKAASQPHIFSRPSLEHYTQPFHRINLPGFKKFAKDFADRLPHFAIPHMDSSKFSSYADYTILPFVDEKEIGRRMDGQGHWTSEGANGRVFQFRIPDEYLKFKFPKNKKIEWFARKKIETPEFMAYMEREHVSYAQRFDDNHIVTLIKAYRLGHSINLIFPRAKANLNHLLRDPVLGYENARRGPLESCGAWRQLRGIARALEKIQGFKPANSNENYEFSQRLCIHFDLKPDNILVEDDDKETWVITDFGQAAITYAEYGRTPRVANGQGTDGYAPPESVVLDMETGRRYDVWSLGCIFLEVAAFVVLGYAGLRGSNEPNDHFGGLDEARRARTAWSRISDDVRFFYRETANGPYVVKKEITTFIDFLKARVEANPENSRTSKAFFAKIIHLINQMLDPNVKTRIDIVEVVRTLSAAMKQASPGTAFVGESEMVAAGGESVIGGPELNSISLWHKTETTNEWDQANLEAFENHAGYVRLHVWSNSQRPIDVVFPRNHVKIVPLYAFWEQAQAIVSMTWIKLLALSPGAPSEMSNTKFSFSGANGLKDARMVQSKLTSQKIVGSFSLASVDLKKYVSVGEKLTNSALRKLGFHKAEAKAKELVSNMPLGTATIQLWIEYMDEAAEKRRSRRSGSARSSDSSRGVRVEGGYNEIPPRRVVLYLHQLGFICTIKMDVNWVLEEDDDDELVLYFEPTEPGKDPYFVACWLRPTPEEQDAQYPAGIPLNPEVLQLAEDTDRFEAEVFALRFFTVQARNEFKARYREVKKEWNLMTKQIQKTEVFMPVNRRPLRFSHSRHSSLANLFPEHKAQFPKRSGQLVEAAVEPLPPPNLDKGKGKADDAEYQEPNMRKASIPNSNFLMVPTHDSWRERPPLSKPHPHLHPSVRRTATLGSYPPNQSSTVVKPWVAGRGRRSGPPATTGGKKKTEQIATQPKLHNSPGQRKQISYAGQARSNPNERQPEPALNMHRAGRDANRLQQESRLDIGQAECESADIHQERKRGMGRLESAPERTDPDVGCSSDSSSDSHWFPELHEWLTTDTWKDMLHNLRVPKELRWNLQFTKPYHSPPCWTYTPSSPELLDNVPLTIAGAPVVIPVWYEDGVRPALIPPPDPHPKFISPSQPLTEDVIEDILQTYDNPLGFYVMINGWLQIIVQNDFDASYALSHRPQTFGGLKVSYIHESVQPSAGQRKFSSNIRSDQVATRKGDEDPQTPRPSVPNRTSNASSLRVGSVIEAGVSNAKRGRDQFKARVGVMTQCDENIFVTVPTHLMTEAWLAAKGTKTLDGCSWINDVTLRSPCRGLTDVRIDHTFDPNAQSFPSGFEHDTSLINITKCHQIHSSLRSPFPAEWLTDEEWNNLSFRYPSTTLQFLSDRERPAKNIPFYDSENLVIGQAVFNFRRKDNDTSFFTRLRKGKTSNSKTTAEDWRDFVAQALLFRVEPQAPGVLDGVSGTAVCLLGEGENGERRAKVAGFTSFVQEAYNSWRLSMDDDEVKVRLRKNQLSFYGALRVPREMRERHRIL